jgi:phosphatidylethanolamine-binding protein
VLTFTDVLEAPNVSLPEDGVTNQGYVVIMIDQDVPAQAADPSAPEGSRTTILHWLQPNLIATEDILTVDVTMEAASTAIGAPYRPPTPPGGDIAHRYTFLLFEQPDNWAIPAEYSGINPPSESNPSAIFGFNITEFMAASGLAEPLAANFLRVINGTEEASSSASTETLTSMPSTTTEGSEASATESGTETTGSEASATASETSAAATETAAAEDGAMAMRGNTREVVIGLAMGVAGAGLWML